MAPPALAAPAPPADAAAASVFSLFSRAACAVAHSDSHAARRRASRGATISVSLAADAADAAALPLAVAPVAVAVTSYRAVLGPRASMNACRREVKDALVASSRPNRPPVRVCGCVCGSG